MNLLNLLLVTVVAAVKLPISVVKDVATLGGSINGGYWDNNQRTYMGKVLDDLGKEVNKAVEK